MAEGGATSYTGRLKDKIKKNKKRIKQLEKEVQKLQEELEDHKNCTGKINYLNEEIKILKYENYLLQQNLETTQTEIIELIKSNTFLEEEMKSTRKELESTKEKSKENEKKLKIFSEKIKEFELSEDQLCIAQLCTSVQKNICEIVLKENYDKNWNYNVNDMEDHITMLIEDEDKQSEARERWKSLKKEINWNPYWLNVMTHVRKERNDVAHPSLTETRIQNAKRNLEREGCANKNIIKAVDKLTKMWTETKIKLFDLQNTAAESGEDNQRLKRSYKKAGRQYYTGCMNKELRRSR